MRALWFALALLPALLFVACEEEEVIAFRPGCEVLLEEVAPSSAPLEGANPPVSAKWRKSQVYL